MSKERSNKFIEVLVPIEEIKNPKLVFFKSKEYNTTFFQGIVGE